MFRARKGFALEHGNRSWLELKAYRLQHHLLVNCVAPGKHVGFGFASKTAVADQLHIAPLMMERLFGLSDTYSAVF